MILTNGFVCKRKEEKTVKIISEISKINSVKHNL